MAHRHGTKARMAPSHADLDLIDDDDDFEAFLASVKSEISKAQTR